MEIPFLEQSGIGLQSLEVLQSLTNPTSIAKSDIFGMIGGGILGLIISNKFPNMVVKYVGMVVGAELGILIARMLTKKTAIEKWDECISELDKSSSELNSCSSHLDRAADLAGEAKEAIGGW